MTSLNDRLEVLDDIPIVRDMLAKSLGLIVLIYLSIYSYEAFHYGVELYCVLFMGLAFGVVWTCRKIISNSYILFIGISCFLISQLDLIHILLHSFSDDIPVFGIVPQQFWIIPRILQPLFFIVGILFIKRKFVPIVVLSGFSLLGVLCITAVSDYCCAFMDHAFQRGDDFHLDIYFSFFALVTFLKYRKAINSKSDSYIIFSISCMLISNALKTFGGGSPELLTFAAIIRLGSVISLYEALVKAALKDPYNILSGELVNGQRSLKDLEDMYYQLFYNINAGVVVVRPTLNGEDFTVVNINSTALSMDNLVTNDTINHNLTDIWPGAYKYGILDAFKRVHKTGIAESFPTSLYIDGHTEGWRDSYIYKLGSGLLVSVYTDETESKRKEETIKENEKRYRIVADFTNDWEYWMDPNENYLYISPAVEKVTGYKPQDFMDDPYLFRKLLHPDDIDRTDLHFDQCRTNRDLPVIDFRIIDKDGEVKWISHTCRSVYHDGEFLGRRANNRDATVRKTLELELFRSKSLLQSLFDGMLTPVFYKDVNLKYIGVNKAFTAFFDMTSEDINGKSVYEAHPKQWADVYSKMDSDLLKTGESQTYDTRMEGTKGNIEDVSLNKTLFYDENGDIAGIIGVIFIITDRKRLEEDLARSEKRFRALAENQYDVFWAIDENFKFDYISPSCERVTGHTVQEVMETVDPSIFYTPESWKVMMEKFINIVQNPLDELAGTVMEIGQYRKDNSLFPSEITVVPIVINGEFKGIQGITRDITERVEAREALVKSKLKFETLLNNLNVAVYRTTPEPGSEFLECNDAAVKIFGADNKSHLLRIKARDLWKNPKDRNDFKIRDAIKNKELDLQRLDGSDLIGSMSAVAVRDKEGKLKYYDCVLEDITDHKSLEAQSYHAIKMEAIGRLAAAVSHDFNNTLAILLGYSGLLRDSLKKESPAYKQADKIYKSVESAKILIRKLLKFSRKDVLEVRPINITKFLKIFHSTVKDFLREDIKLKFVFVATSVHSEEDVSQLEQIFMNLVVNAQDAMPNGGLLSIECDIVNLDESYVIKRPNVIPGEYVLISVSDTGCGIPKDVIDKIFDPFFTTKMDSSGTGLGLSTVYGIVKQYNGDVWVYSEEGKGTTFKVYLPVTNKRFVPKKISIIDVNLEEDVGGDETILLLEDESMLLSMATDVLSAAGYYVLPYISSVKCLEDYKAGTEMPDLLITDIVMPDLGGRDLYKELLKVLPGLKVIFMSGYTKDIISETGLIDANTAFIQKPFSNTDLRLLVRRILDFKEV